MPLEEKTGGVENGRETREGQAPGNQAGLRKQQKGWKRGTEGGQYVHGWN